MPIYNVNNKNCLRNCIRFVREMGRFLTISKVQALSAVFSSFGILYIIASLPELKSNLRTSGCVNQQNRKSTVTVKSPVYWLSAKNADSGYMNHVKETFQRIGFERWDGVTGDWDVMWSYEYPFGSTVTTTSLKSYQRVGCISYMNKDMV